MIRIPLHQAHRGTFGAGAVRKKGSAPRPAASAHRSCGPVDGRDERRSTIGGYSPGFTLQDAEYACGETQPGIGYRATPPIMAGLQVICIGIAADPYTLAAAIRQFTSAKDAAENSDKP